MIFKETPGERKRREGKKRGERRSGEGCRVGKERK